jgi:predicted nucleic acid-binding protein
LKVFFDTNVVLDVLLRRAPHYDDSVQVWGLAEKGRIEGSVSALSFSNIYYVVRKALGARAAQSVLRAVRDVFQVAACDEQVILQAVDSGLSDFEDAVQFFSAVRIGASCIVTRNSDHFPKGDLPVLTPAEFLAAHGGTIAGLADPQ